MLRWLHCSDFHIGKDRTAQERLLEKILEHVGSMLSKGFIPDFIFVTGDLANSGTPREYAILRKDFVDPLKQTLGENWGGRIFAVPGNHDVDRTKNDNFDRESSLAPSSEFFDPNKNGQGKREILSPRFKGFRQKAPVDVSGNWISSPEGSFAESFDINGIQVGVVGINTAWLSKEGSDARKLTPGFNLTESALKKIQNCQVRFVLGHHPLHWLQEEQAHCLRALFGYHQVIYLHGHLHKAEGRQEDGAGRPFLTLQSGAAFQARDGEPWHNGLLWGEIDIKTEQVRISPRYWNPGNYDWPVESGRFPEILRLPDSDWWAYPLPKITPQKAQVKQPIWFPPEGWEVISREYLNGMRREITGDEAERFFDGAEPEWAYALCPKFPRRAIVTGLIDQISAFQGQEKPLVMLLTGPGGEGKSMVLRQTLLGLLDADHDLQVLWQNDDSSGIPVDALIRLPQGPWVIVSDTADLSAKALLDATAALHRARRSDIRILLCARDTDWRASGAAHLDWSRCADHRTKILSGLTESDATLIASAWTDFDGANTGIPANTDVRARELYEAAQREATVSEGSLLGGALSVRRGAGLRDHVHRLLNRLEEQQLPSGGTLYHAFGYIAAMHGNGLDFLSRPVLARVLGCDPGMLAKQILLPLAKEAAGGGGSVLLTRHRRIAQAAISIMSEELGEDIAGRLEDLARAAICAYSERIRIPEIHKWKYDLAEHFMTKSIAHGPETAIRIARAVFGSNPTDPKLVVNLARIHRESGEPAEGAQVLESFTGKVGDHRGFWREWATCAGNIGEYPKNAILAGWSLADQAAAIPPNFKDAVAGLTCLGIAFGKLYENFGDIRLINALSATSHLGFLLGNLEDRDRRGFENFQATSLRLGARTATTVDAFRQLQAGLTAAWEISGQPACFPAQIVPPASMHFCSFERLFIVNSNQ